MQFLIQGDRGIWVEYLQLALTRAGYPTRIDGIFGEHTCQALKDFTGNTDVCTVNRAVWEQLKPYLTGYRMHTIEKGDTVFGLSRRYGTTEEAILVANPLIDPDDLVVDAILAVPLGFPLVPQMVKYTSVLTQWIIDGLVVRYPFLSAGVIGKSVMGKDIHSLWIGTGEKQVFYSASYHANESITTPVLLTFAEEYAAAYAAGGNIVFSSAVREEHSGQTGMGQESVDARTLFDEYRLCMVPLVNPDGVDLVNGLLNSGIYYRRARQITDDYPAIPFPDGWKANIDGVDLNLQFPAGWEMAKQIKFSQGYDKPAPRDFVGEAPLTAPESVAVYELTKENDFLLILAYHTQGEVIYWKYLDYEPARSKEIADYFASVSGYAVEETPSASGYAGYKDWFIEEYDRPGYTIEAGMGENPLPMTQFERIYHDNKGILVGGMTQLR